MALRLAELIAGRVAAEAFQLAIEYDPQPPFDSGSYAKASQEAKDYLAARPRRGWYRTNDVEEAQARNSSAS